MFIIIKSRLVMSGKDNNFLKYSVVIPRVNISLDYSC
jgi:hypothetical protein